MIYITTCAALPVLRRKAGAPRALLQVPGGVAVAAAAILLACWLLSNSTWREARDTAIAAVLGFVIFAASGLHQPHVKRSEEPEHSK
jgi:amino acid transporter